MRHFCALCIVIATVLMMVLFNTWVQPEVATNVALDAVNGASEVAAAMRNLSNWSSLGGLIPIVGLLGVIGVYIGPVRRWIAKEQEKNS